MRKKVTPVFVLPPKAFYVKGEVKFEPKSTSVDSNSIFSVTLKEVCEDYSTGAPILLSVRFDETRIRVDCEASCRRAFESLGAQSS